MYQMICDVLRIILTFAIGIVYFFVLNISIYDVNEKEKAKKERRKFIQATLISTCLYY